MKMLVILSSYHHNNTKKIVDAIVKHFSDAVQIDVLDTSTNHTIDSIDYDTVVLASGVYFGKLHRSLYDKLKAMNFKNTPQFLLLLTAGSKSDYSKKIENELSKDFGINIESSYQSLGFDTFGPFKLIGGISKGHPNESEINGAISWISKFLTAQSE